MKDIKEKTDIIESYDYKVLKSFINRKHKWIFKVIDKNGYIFQNELYKIIALKDNNRQIFRATNPFVVDNIKHWIDLNHVNIKLLSKIFVSATAKMDWKCLKCNSNFNATWNDISSMKLCPYCVSKKVNDTNSVASQYPYLVKEWDFDKNGDLIPENVSYGSNKLIWWKCNKCGRSWKALVSTRNDGHGCPYCAGEKSTEIYNLLICFPEIIKEWNYNKNSKLPQAYLPYSSKKVWWKCKDCGYEWKTEIVNRTKLNSGCPKCNKSHGEKKIREYIENHKIIYEPQKRFYNLRGINNGILSYDFYLSNKNLLIEYQGEQHKHYRKGMYFKYTQEQFKKQQEHDKRKRQYAKDHNIKLLEIWYWDYNNIEEILDKAI